MDSISRALTQLHRDCDNLFVAAENAVSANLWDNAQQQFAQFRHTTEQHLRAEEEVLFPAFEQRTGNSMGPTQMMRMEHVHIRELIGAIQRSLEKRDKQEYLGLSDTLMVLLQQHNFKEENVLYPMTDQVLANDRAQLLGRMQHAETASGAAGG